MSTPIYKLFERLPSSLGSFYKTAARCPRRHLPSFLYLYFYIHMSIPIPRPRRLLGPRRPPFERRGAPPPRSSITIIIIITIITIITIIIITTIITITIITIIITIIIIITVPLLYLCY